MTNVSLDRAKRINVVVDRRTYEDLKLLGEVPDSFNDVIRRLLEEKQPVIQAIREAKAKH